jgi:hypothetical protein
MMSVIGHFFLNFVVGASSTWLQDLRRNNMRERPGRFSPQAPEFFSPRRDYLNLPFRHSVEYCM